MDELDGLSTFVRTDLLCLKTRFKRFTLDIFALVPKKSLGFVIQGVFATFDTNQIIKPCTNLLLLLTRLMKP
jgi:hypothetical protein